VLSRLACASKLGRISHTLRRLHEHSSGAVSGPVFTDREYKSTGFARCHTLHIRLGIINLNVTTEILNVDRRKINAS
uniref:Uncharacterized protein n=1 Tax=Anopheles atroparvus TaxID=41427 RepID=A0AAG5DGH8_ANOAO